MSELIAGTSAVVLETPIGAEMMGYGARTGAAASLHDPLHARALYLATDSDLLLIECELCLMAPSQAEAIRERIEARTGVARERILVGCIHTHSGPDTGLGALLQGSDPPDHVAPLLEAAIEAGVQARANAAAARLGVGCAEAQIGRNRRRADGPLDTDVLVIRVDRADGSPLSVLYVHGCHPTALGHDNLAYSADWPWAAGRAIQEGLPGCNPIFVLGAHADVDPRTRGLLDLGIPGQSVGVGFDQVEVLGREIGQAVVGAASAIETRPEAAVAAGSSRVRIPVHRADLERRRLDALAALDLPPDSEARTGELYRLESERTADSARGAAPRAGREGAALSPRSHRRTFCLWERAGGGGPGAPDRRRAPARASPGADGGRGSRLEATPRRTARRRGGNRQRLASLPPARPQLRGAVGGSEVRDSSIDPGAGCLGAAAGGGRAPGSAACEWTHAMKRERIADLLGRESAGGRATARGWLRSVRHSKGVSFLDVTDGSCLSGIQAVVDAEVSKRDATVSSLGTGCAVRVTGELVESPGKGQRFEIRAEEVELIGDVDSDYPLQKKRHSFEFLRTIAHLRPRTNTIAAVMRVRNAASRAIHDFFQERGFLLLHSPVITLADAEGAGEMFRVTSLDPSEPPRKDGGVDWSQDFFGREAHLTVSGQLEAEIAALALDRRLHLRPHLPRGGLEHESASGRVLDGRAGDGLLRSGR